MIENHTTIGKIQGNNYVNTVFSSTENLRPDRIINNNRLNEYFIIKFSSTVFVKSQHNFRLDCISEITQ